jgi:hypothetical protein
MTKNEQFKETLNRGMKFEQGPAIDALHAMFPDYYIINNQIDPSASTGDKIVGPRLYKGANREKEYIAPDFTLFHDNKPTMWVDAKLKGAAYPFKGRLYFTIDIKKQKEYCSLPKFMKENFWLLFCHEPTGELYFAKFREKPATVYFNNQHGKGETPVYYLDGILKLEFEE